MIARVGLTVIRPGVKEMCPSRISDDSLCSAARHQRQHARWHMFVGKLDVGDTQRVARGECKKVWAARPAAGIDDLA